MATKSNAMLFPKSSAKSVDVMTYLRRTPTIQPPHPLQYLFSFCCASSSLLAPRMFHGTNKHMPPHQRIDIQKGHHMRCPEDDVCAACAVDVVGDERGRGRTWGCIGRGGGVSTGRRGGRRDRCCDLS